MKFTQATRAHRNTQMENLSQELHSMRMEMFDRNKRVGCGQGRGCRLTFLLTRFYLPFLLLVPYIGNNVRFNYKGRVLPLLVFDFHNLVQIICFISSLNFYSVSNVVYRVLCMCRRVFYENT